MKRRIKMVTIGITHHREGRALALFLIDAPVRKITAPPHQVEEKVNEVLQIMGIKHNPYTWLERRGVYTR